MSNSTAGSRDGGRRAVTTIERKGREVITHAFFLLPFSLWANTESVQLKTGKRKAERVRMTSSK